MAGHSKWANIKHKKAATDAKRGKAFSKIAKELTVAARMGGSGDPETNINLRPILAKAKSVNMPAENIERAIKKGTGEGADTSQIEELIYEGYASGGVGVIVKALTDNKNRTAAEVRSVFNKHNCSLGQTGSVSRMFQRKGLFEIDTADIEEEALLETAMMAGAENFEQEGDVWTITCAPGDYNQVSEALDKAGYVATSSEVKLVPDVLTQATDAEHARSVMKFIDALDELDDVQDVYTDLDVSDEIADQLDEG
ncbi:MAG: YebC/PmpR family DNA-binding transcriptional regulator [Verrucomicrobia bacterium]|nr:YebC/PmpR family DNA-binding transcriptional regulator [Verrucomicrobiota bacterium]MCH8512363.1 YebC/PmpR family DNA-binding transcriptional regulator [Kiritimatiellia bacterium]